VNLSHPDLAGRLVSEGTDLTGSGAPNAEDAEYHGTAVAGVIAAVRDNHFGIAGMESTAMIDPYRVCDATACFADAEARAVLKAVANGAKVINLSLGNSKRLEYEAAAMAYAYEHDVVVVAASGNDGSGVPEYPAAYEGVQQFTSAGSTREYVTDVISVGAINDAGDRAVFAGGGGSNYGATVDVAAPGARIYTTTPRVYQGIDTRVYTGALDGTSFAAPFVSALAATLRSLPASEVSSTGKPLSAHEVRRRIELTAHRVGTDGSGLGYGLIDAFDAVFNGSFESDALNGWAGHGFVFPLDIWSANYNRPAWASSTGAMGGISPVDGGRMLAISAQPFFMFPQPNFTDGEADPQSALLRDFGVDPTRFVDQSGATARGSVEISFAVDFVTEWPDPDARGNGCFGWVSSGSTRDRGAFPEWYYRWDRSAQLWNDAVCTSTRRSPLLVRAPGGATVTGRATFHTGWRRVRLLVPIQADDPCPPEFCTLYDLSLADHVELAVGSYAVPSGGGGATTLIDDVRVEWVPPAP
jgi:hypothetical protein